MAKFAKSESFKDKLKKPKRGRITKSNKKFKKHPGSPEPDDRLNESSESLPIKKKPSKFELKSVIATLNKDPDLIAVRKALKYVPYYLKSEGLTKKVLKEIIRLWAEASEKIRVICLLCLIRIYTKVKDGEKRQMIATKLYNTFLDKCRVTKHESMSMIGFMRHSLIELYKIDREVAFKQAQISCQQLSVTLKNACTHKNEETYKTVLNWQYANCLILLTRLITSHDENSQVRSLTNQAIQLNIGALNLLTSPRYLPFYCHLIENLICLSDSSKSFIPILPQLMRILDKLNIPLEKTVKANAKPNGHPKRRNSSASSDEEGVPTDEDSSEDDEVENGTDEVVVKKQYNMDLLNHVSLEEAHNLEYNVAVLNKVCELLLIYLSSQSNRIAFPELALLPRIQIKKWLKRNPGKPAQKLKALLEKINSDCEKVEESRKSIDFAFTDFVAVDAWEKKLRDTGCLNLPKAVKQLHSK